jgi:hypothetical protein
MIENIQATISLPSINFLGEVNTLVHAVIVKDLIKNYLQNSTYSLISAAVKLEVLQANWHLPGLFRAINYPNIDYDMQTTAEIIFSLLEFEQQYNVLTKHAINLEVRMNENLVLSKNFYNTGLPQQLDLITPHLTVNPVLLLDKNTTFEFLVTLPPAYQNVQKDRFNINGVMMANLFVENNIK